MDRSNLEKVLTFFQAYARGYLMRKEVHRAGKDFEDIVKEIDGGLTHLRWREAVIPMPHFTYTDGPLIWTSNSASKPNKSGIDVCAILQSPSKRAPSSEEKDHRVLPQKMRAERDDSQTKVQSSLPDEFLPTCGNAGDAGIMQNTGVSDTVWSTMQLDMNCGHSQKGSQKYCSAQEVPCTPEALRLRRNTLTMELLWLQQAIDSRKKYLSLKNRLSVS